MASSSDILRAALDAIMQERSVSRSQARRYLIERIDREKRIKLSRGSTVGVQNRIRKPNPHHRELEP